jgi:dihydroxyacid dehydratase/phosphogluconate dehydratase
LKPVGRYVAKNMFEAGGVPLLMRTLLDHGYLHGAQQVGRARNGVMTHPGAAAEKACYAGI